MKHPSALFALSSASLQAATSRSSHSRSSHSCRPENGLTSLFLLAAATTSASIAGPSMTEAWLAIPQRHELLAVGGPLPSTAIRTVAEVQQTADEWTFSSVADYVPVWNEHAGIYEHLRMKMATWPCKATKLEGESMRGPTW